MSTDFTLGVEEEAEEAGASQDGVHHLVGVARTEEEPPPHSHQGSGWSGRAEGATGAWALREPQPPSEELAGGTECFTIMI